MHGRLKVKSKSDKEKEKQAEKEEKCRQLKAGISKTFSMRKSGEDENALTITASILVSCPDVSTLWNYRKELVLKEKAKLDGVETVKLEDASVKMEASSEAPLSVPSEIEPQPEDPKKTFQELCEVELELTANCLMKNPKSYGAWYHRAWILKIVPLPDFQKELNLCRQFLEMDERNFHCWDHRRFVWNLSKQHSANRQDFLEELGFTLKKIEQNFSNFSSWYYRSSLFTEAQISGVLDFKQFWHEEYSLVENALFTDPSDQSPWFYLRWLIATNFGHSVTSFAARNQTNKIEVLKLLYCKHSGTVCIVLSKSTSGSPYKLVSLNNDEESTSFEVTWQPALDNYSNIWYFKATFPDVFTSVELSRPNNVAPYVLPERSEFLLHSNSGADVFVVDHSAISPESGHVRWSLKEKQYKSLICLQEMEPSNKWINLTVALLNIVDTNQAQVYEKLKVLDPLRRNYFSDQQSKNMVRERLEVDELNSNLRLNDCSLTRLYYIDQLLYVRLLDLSHNKLCVLGSAFNSLIFLESLLLDHNEVSLVSENFNPPSLTILSLQHNRINHQGILKTLSNCKSLASVYLFGNGLQLPTEEALAYSLFSDNYVDNLYQTYCDRKIIEFSYCSKNEVQ